MNDTQLKNALESGAMDSTLAELYQDVDAARKRYVAAIDLFTGLFGAKDDVHIFSAPGRTEVGGNHTDHQHGMVLAASVNLDTIAVVAARDDNEVQLHSEGYTPMRFTLDDLEVDELAYGTTPALIKGVAAGMQKHGYKTGGFCAYVTSQVLNGAGMSSSAAFEALTGAIFNGLYNDNAMDAQLNAQIGQYAENVYFGKPCGLMDQMACSVGGFVHIDFKDPAHPVVEPIALDMTGEGYSLCIVDTKGSHADLTGEYAAIPAEMKAVAECFGKEVMREVAKDEFMAKMPELRDKVGDRALLRAYHFLKENARVQDEADALKEGRFEDFLELVKASGNSSYKFLQNIYANQDAAHQAMSLALAVSEDALEGRGVCRVHGGGFAGTIQAFVKTEAVEDYNKVIEHLFGEGTCHVLMIRPKGAIQIA